MLDVVFFLLAMGSGGAGTGPEMGTAMTGAQTAPVVSETAIAATPQPAPTRVAEDQTPSGRFLTATETKPILTATKGNWVAVREFNGQDLLYFTHLLSWRCGLYEINYSINGGAMQPWPMPDCHADGPSPNAITPADGDPYIAFELGHVQMIDIQILYDDLSTDWGSYDRASVKMP